MEIGEQLSKTTALRMEIIEQFIRDELSKATALRKQWANFDMRNLGPDSAAMNSALDDRVRFWEGLLAKAEQA